MQRRLYALQPGDVVAGLKIMAVDKASELQDVVFEVEYLCCNRVDTIKYSGLRHRITNGSERCNKCAPRGTPGGAKPAPAEPVYGLTLPDWPRPPGVAPGRWIWGARGLQL